MEGRDLGRRALSAWMQTLRHDYLRWTQQEVADAIGVTSLTVGLWERGGQTPSPLCYEALSALAKSVGAPPPPDIDRRRGPRFGEKEEYDGIARKPDAASVR